LQHRGQEAAGIAVSDGSQVLVFKDLGLVSQVFDEDVLASLRGHIAVGHCRYSTTGSTTWENAQPTFCTTATGASLALAHNGHLVNTTELMVQARQVNAPVRNGETTDSSLVTQLLASAAADTNIENAAQRLPPQLRGAFSLVFCDEDRLYAARDLHGVRPLVLGRLKRG
jgi:amidophosphoribosyltransferase